MLEGVLKNEECLDMNMLYDVIDWYKRAVILARDIEVIIATEFTPTNFSETEPWCPTSLKRS